MAVTFFLPFFTSISADYALNHTNVQKLIHDENLHFDLIINHEIFHDSFLMFSHRFQAPVVTICTVSAQIQLYFVVKIAFNFGCGCQFIQVHLEYPIHLITVWDC